MRQHSVGIGFGIAVATQAAVFPIFGLHASLGQNLQLGLIFTVISVGRSFALRRFFEHLRVRRSRNRQRAPVAAIAAPGPLYVRAPFKAL